MQSTRQSELFAGQDWQVLYRAFVEVNFNASDPPSINRALRDYIRTNYPEDFNDWIENSEFVAIIDLLSWLAGNLALKTDLAARENFLETAEARESVLRLARFLSYNPSRCLPATGVVKIVEVSTDDYVTDSFGTNLANTPVIWNNPDDPNWFERFTAILNNAFVTTNPFGVPLKTGTVASIPVQLYRVNGRASASNLGFTANVMGSAMTFEVCNGDFDDGGTLKERTPNPAAAFHMYYLNDSNGYASDRNGFFLLFKQGVTNSNVYNIPSPVENLLIDIPTTGVNQNDVWVQTVDDDGTVMTDWIKVPAVLSSNITYNNLPVDQRNIFSVITRDQDAISIRFSDGRFGNAPTGNIRVTYRVSNGLTYTIKPQEIDRIRIPISYINRSGAPRTLYLTFSLFETVANAAAAETTDQIRQRAPLVYATQNRMVSGEDYNTFPLSTNLAVKLKAVNRVYSGHSRYIDLNDPTGTYRDLSIYADDGIFFKERVDLYTEVPVVLNRTPDEIIGNTIQPMLRSVEMLNAVRDLYVARTRDTQAIERANLRPTGLIWRKVQASNFSSTGYFSSLHDLILPGAMIQVQEGTAEPRWVGIVGVSGSITHRPAASLPGPVTLTDSVADGAQVLAIIPRFVAELPIEIINAIKDKIEKRLSFSLSYDYGNAGGKWSVGPQQTSLGEDAFTGIGGTEVLLMTVDFVPGLWRVAGRGMRYVFESLRAVEWYDDGSRATDTQTGVASKDLVRIMRINENLNDLIAGEPSGRALRRDFDLGIDKLWFYSNGAPEPRRTKVTFTDSDGDGFPDDPDTFFRVVSSAEANSYLFWKRVSTPYETPLIPSADLPGGGVWVFTAENLRQEYDPQPPTGTVAFQISSPSTLRRNTFWIKTETGWDQDFSGTYRYAIGRGPNVGAKWIAPPQASEEETGLTVVQPYGNTIAFHWKHYAPSNHRIDPASTNIHDMFVLTYTYDAAMRQWVTDGANPATMPKPPSEFDLRVAFNSLDQYRMFSDQIVWRPVRYKLLFGNGAADELRATFKVVRLPNASVSDGEIKTRVIRAINEFFSVDNWDFGETFYYTELAAYIHQQLATLIGSCVIVPLNASASFGDGFEVACRSDEIFLSTAQVSDVVLINSNTPANLRIR